MFRKSIIGFVVLLSLGACSYFQKEETADVVARVGDNYLYKKDLSGIYGENMSREDSMVVQANFINAWAAKQLFMEKARINLPEEQVAEFEKLIAEYRTDLYTTTYKEALVNSTMDTAVSEAEIKSFYNNTEDNFKLNEELWRFRYIEMSKDFDKVDEVREKFKKYEETDRAGLEEMAIQFRSYSLEDSIWVSTSQIFQKLPILALEKNEKNIKKSHFIELTDSLGVYLVYINDILHRNDTAPMSYVKPTIKQILLNRKKLEFIRKLEKEIMDEAVRTKKFEIYEESDK
ncbi:peptidyl-prolyl cis-trans isomerase [Sinomicrobium weinanense]|uniref:Peptidyl-prolyl cis-trans isomerase n=1 Tax=Sinomicrobium weinanense TaxID=2842200 RepID=A0A926Q4X6_9FLAO|nr:peptidyl-prolyl cis-trans isomerase [Sinomicrobium weinanense]MBC9797365.1 peptidyl-prolyl cis-trans isomerase [Sinomicrobium weinanense]MBU3123404.1 peptidyl-prolyl cis-trans isomerase [Sinomicrobium weinanense]